MYAVIKTGGKQYRVAKNDVIEIERLPVLVGETIAFEEVLMVGGDAVQIGQPLVVGAKVTATVLDQTRGPKILILKKKRRKNHRRKKGHRQDLTMVRVQDIHLA